jgi:hypothetical protein
MGMRSYPLALVLLSSCSELEVPTAPPARASSVLVEPVGDLAAAPAVLRLRVAGVLGRSALGDFRLFEGKLSAYYLRHLAAREAPESLLERETPALVWADGTDAVVAPLRALPSGRYSLVTPELGLLAEVVVDDALVPWLERLWPPRAENQGNGFAVFCGPLAPLAAPGPVMLEPAGLAAELRLGIGVAGLFGEQCVSLEPSAPASDGAPALPPALAGGVGFEPLPSVVSADPVAPVSCEAEELALGPACAVLDDDRVLLRAPEEPALFVIEEPAPLLGVTAPGASLVVRGLEPGTPVRFRASAFDRMGVGTSIERLLTGAERRPHVVISEVLANPAGPEDGGEWLELVNDGRDSVELEGFELRDTGGAVSLPDARLAPGEYLLLVPRGFAPDLELDVPPAKGTRTLELDALGRSGLANGGELLRLSDASGRVLSRFPALKASQAGMSLARRTPGSPDDEASSFGLHAAPGASPGAPNTLP